MSPRTWHLLKYVTAVTAAHPGARLAVSRRGTFRVEIGPHPLSRWLPKPYYAWRDAARRLAAAEERGRT